MSTPAENLESAAAETLESFKTSCSDCCECCSEKIRSSPITAVLIAAGIGYIFRFTPIVAILAVLTRILLILAKPALLIFGLLKLVECLQCRQAKPLAGDLAGSSEPLVDSPPGPA